MAKRIRSIFRRGAAILCCLVLPLTLTACAKESPDRKILVRLAGRTMGTSYQFKIVSPEKSREAFRALAEHIAALFIRINSQVNHYQPDSEISRFNALPPGVPLRVGGDFVRVLKLSNEIRAETAGALDVTLGALIDLWGFGPGREPLTALPDAEQIRLLTADRDSDKVVFAANDEIMKTRDGVKLNLSAVAKGYAVDQVAELLKENGHHDFMLEVGGEIYAAGTNIRGYPWSIGVVHDKHHLLKVTDRGLASSGDYQNFVEIEGKRYAHILDPRTGYPVDNAVIGVTVLAPSVMLADAAATAITVLGIKSGMEWVNRRTDLEAMIVYRDDSSELQEVISNGFARFISI